MSKEVLISKLSEIDTANYSWNIYFFNIDNRSRSTNPFKVNKVKFKKTNYLNQYVNNSLHAIYEYQVMQISEVQEYNGENTKISCDKIDLNSPLIDTQWSHLKEAVRHSSDNEIKGKIHGYLLEGNKTTQNSETDSIILVKLANPIANLNTKKAVIFTSSDNELDLLSDDMYRLYLTTDFIITNNTMYTFNHSFEKVFALENTMKKVKDNAIIKIIDSNCFADNEEFKTLANSYSSSRTFVSLNNERMQKLQTQDGISYIAATLNIELDENGKFSNLNEENTGKLIQYLCYKIIKDDESKNLMRVSNAILM